MGARFAGCLADSRSVCRPEVPPFIENIAPAGTLRAMKSLLGGLPGEPQEKEYACRLATLPMRMGGLGLRSATRMAPAACWASWADALHMVQERLPTLAQSIVVPLEAAAEPVGCLSDLRAAGNTLDRHGFVGRPQWPALQACVHLPSLTLNPVSGPTAANIMHLPLLNTITGRSLCSCPANSGAGSSQVLVGCPTKPESRIAPDLFRTLILERLRLPLLVCEVRCECGLLVDGHGRYRAACPHSGRLRTRASAPERTLARVCREAGASVRFNAKLVDMNRAVPADDAREVEVLASGLPLFYGAQLAVDITLRSALTATGLPRPGAAVVDGIVHSELLHGDRCGLAVVALETGGRWSLEAVDFIERLAMARARARTTQSATVSFSVLEAPLDSHDRHFMRTVVCQLVCGPVLSPSRACRC